MFSASTFQKYLAQVLTLFQIKIFFVLYFYYLNGCRPTNCTFVINQLIQGLIIELKFKLNCKM